MSTRSTHPARSLALLALTALGIGALAACSGGDDPYHCDFVATGEEDRCQERTLQVPDPAGVTRSGYETLCNTSGGAYGDGPCPEAGRVLGCDITSTGSGEQVVDWYYAPETVASVEETCADEGDVVQP
ncbi:MAG: hypothetical protein R3F61_15615 [Myxococcota bacterium]